MAIWGYSLALHTEELTTRQLASKFRSKSGDLWQVLNPYLENRMKLLFKPGDSFVLIVQVIISNTGHFS